MSRSYAMAKNLTVTADDDGDITVFDARRGRYWRGNRGAGEVIALLAEPRSQAEIADILARRHGVDVGIVDADTRQILVSLRAARLVTARGRP